LNRSGRSAHGVRRLLTARDPVASLSRRLTRLSKHKAWTFAELDIGRPTLYPHIHKLATDGPGSNNPIPCLLHCNRWPSIFSDHDPVTQLTLVLKLPAQEYQLPPQLVQNTQNTADLCYSVVPLIVHLPIPTALLHFATPNKSQQILTPNP
jgi:hypothetical protein